MIDEIKALRVELATARALAEDRRKACDMIVGDVQELREALAAARRECEGLRKLLWLRHGCPPASLYGDDGEIQCGNSTCLIDFKRMSLETIEERLAAPGDGEEGTR